ncbi:hypothetical protein DMENIID0001_103810 [Sergentomyia squamirostris]
MKPKGKVHKYFKELSGNRRACIFCKAECSVNGTRMKFHMTECRRTPQQIRNYFIMEIASYKKQYYCQRASSSKSLPRVKTSPSPTPDIELEFLNVDAEGELEQNPDLPEDKIIEELTNQEEEESESEMREEPKNDKRDFLEGFLAAETRRLELEEERHQREKEEHEIKMKILNTKLKILEKQLTM